MREEGEEEDKRGGEERKEGRKLERCERRKRN